MKEVNLTQDKKALIDDEDFDKVKKYSWFYLSSGYAAASVQTEKGPTTILMHNIVNPPPPGLINHHKDENGLNNTKNNLQFVTHSTNHLLQGLIASNTSGYKGVTYHKKNRKWVAHIRINRRLNYLGSFKTAQEAALAYKAALLAHVL